MVTMKVEQLPPITTPADGDILYLLADPEGAQIDHKIAMRDLRATLLNAQTLTYKGNWNASTNTPTLADGTGNPGDFYLVTTPGTVNFGSGPVVFATGDRVQYGGGKWTDIPPPVVSPGEIDARAYGVVGDDTTDCGAFLDAAYDAAEAGGGLPLVLPHGSIYSSIDVLWDSDIVSIRAPGSGACSIRPAGSAKVIARPAVFTVKQGPRFRGFTIQGGPTPGAVGLYSGDIVSSEWDDVVIRDFTGAGAIGVQLDNVTTETERNIFGLTIDNCTNDIVLSVNGGGDSFGYNEFNLRLNANAGQTGFITRDNALFYSGKLRMICNIADDGTAFDIRDTSQIQRVEFSGGAEQTSGTGGYGRKVAATAFVDGYGQFSFENGLIDDFAGGVRRTPSFRVPQPDATTAGQDSAHEGVVASWAARGTPANIHPLLWDTFQDPYSTFGIATGTLIRSPFATMLDDPHNAWVIGRVPGGANLEDFLTVHRVTAHGDLEFPLVEPPTLVLGAALGSSPPAGSVSGNNTVGTIALGTGGSTVVGKLASVTYLTPRAHVGEVFLDALSDPSKTLRVFTARTATGFDIYSLTDVPVAAQAAGYYVWSYFVAGG